MEISLFPVFSVHNQAAILTLVGKDIAGGAQPRYVIINLACSFSGVRSITNPSSGSPVSQAKALHRAKQEKVWRKGKASMISSLALSFAINQGLA